MPEGTTFAKIQLPSYKVHPYSMIHESFSFIELQKCFIKAEYKQIKEVRTQRNKKNKQVRRAKLKLANQLA